MIWQKVVGGNSRRLFFEVFKKNVNYLNLCTLKIIFVEICKISDAKNKERAVLAAICGTLFA
jgi:hypothetical protein